MLSDDVGLSARPETRRVLIVEDVEATRYAIRRTLERAGFQVVEAATGTDGLRVAASTPLDVVVLDVHLPDMTGLEVRRRIKASPQTARVPVLHLSATVLDAKQRAEAIEGGADAFLSQPVEPDELIAVLHALLRMHDLERRLDVSERRWQQTFRGAQIGMALIGLDGVLLLVNSQFASMLHRTVDDLVDRPVLSVVHEDDISSMSEALTRAGRSGRDVTLAVRHLVAGGDEAIDVEVSLSLVRGPDRSPLHLLEQVTDLTQRRRAERLLQEVNERYRDPVLSSPAGQFVAEPDGTIVDANPAFWLLTGLRPNGPAAVTLRSLVLDEDRSMLAGALERTARQGSTHVELRLVRPQHAPVDVALVVAAMTDQQDGMSRLVGSLHDISERKQAERALAASEQRFASAFEDAPIGMALVSPRQPGKVGAVEQPNRTLCALLRTSRGELSDADLADFVHGEERERLRGLLDSVTDSQPSATAELRLADAVGADRWVAVSVSRLVTPEKRQLLVHVLDISERRLAQQALSERALHDRLTSLPNRALLIDRLEQALARSKRVHSTTAVLFLDLDNFKLVNDSLGHDAGDQLLVAVADAIRGAIREGDTAARLGGDEFVVLCEDLHDERELVTLVERIAAAVARPVTMQGAELNATASIGVAVAADEHSAPEQLLRDADLAMYEAKRRGPGHWEMFDRSLRVRAHERLRIETELRAAIRRSELVVFYQPIVELATGHLVGLEALLRWQHPTRGLLLPDDFLSVAESTGLIVSIGADCLTQACAQLAAWRALPGWGDLQMSVNLSLKQLLQRRRFGRRLATTLQDTAVDPSAVRLEITESVLPDAAVLIRTELDEVTALGVTLGIDDFGTGYSSLMQLRRLPVKFIKIDRSFVGGFPNDPQDTAIVESVVRLGHALRLQTIAEGIERREQLEALQALGCRHGQGYYFRGAESAPVIGSLLTSPQQPWPVEPASTTPARRVATAPAPRARPSNHHQEAQ